MTAPGLADPPAPNIRWGTARARWIMLATVLGSGLSMLDSTVVNVALPALGANLDASLGDLQWVVNGYTLALAALILLGGSLGDRFGRRRIFVVGVVWFAAGSLPCGLSPTIGWLIAARILQGVGGALLVPGSLAIISPRSSAPTGLAPSGPGRRWPGWRPRPDLSSVAGWCRPSAGAGCS